MSKGSIAPIFFLVLSTALVATGFVATPAQAQYPVGTSDTTFVDPARGDRAIPVDLYYPAESAGPDQPPADPPPEGFAAVAFGHGFLMSAGVYSWVAQRMAELGCVVALPRTGGELFPDHEEFALDLAFSSVSLRDSGDDPGSRFFGRMGPRTLVMGHSMGGGCSFLAAASDSTITAVANFAAAETNPSAIAACGGIDGQVLMFAGTNDCVTPPADHQIPMYEALGGPRTLVTIEGASHCQFNAYSFLCELGEFCSPDISRQEQQDIVLFLLEPWVSAVLFLDYDAAQEFQTRLETGTGFAYVQDGLAAAPRVRPGAAYVLEASPSPFRSAAVLHARVSTAGPVRLDVFDARGRHVRTLAERFLPAGRYSYRWDGRDGAGREAPSGVYTARLSGASGTGIARLVLIH
jgi:dienelactone hydrolase